MEILYVGWLSDGHGSYTLIVLVKEENQIYKAEVNAIAEGVIDPEYSYRPLDFCGLNENLVKDLIYRSKPIMQPEIHAQDRKYSYAIQFENNQLQELKKSISLEGFEKVDSFETVESVLYKPNDTLKIVERFELVAKHGKLSIVSVNSQTGEEVYLQTLSNLYRELQHVID
jgi:hypothetical protein